MTLPDMQKHPRRSIGAQRNPHSANAIVAAAEAVLAEEGYGAFSIEKVARRAKAGKPTIYKWWPNKTALLLDVYLRQKSIDFPDTGEIEEDIVQFMLSILRHWRETPSGTIFRSIVAEAQSDATAASKLRDFAREREDDTAFLIWRALTRKEIVADIRPLDVARWIGAWLWYRLLTGQLDIEEAEVRRDVGILVAGLCRTDAMD